MRYTYVRQHDTTDCAAACLAMVCLHYKKEVTITRLRDMMGTDLKGTNLVGLQKAANELGFTTAAVRVDRENFLSDFSLPCIAQVITDQGLAHFVVVFKKTTIKDDGARRKHMLQDAETRKEEEEKGKKHKCKDYVIIGDPATERVHTWFGYDRDEDENEIDILSGKLYEQEADARAALDAGDGKTL